MKPIDPAALPLRDIHLPASISAWPPAPGWWLLGLAALLGPLLGVAWLVWKRRTRLRREALAELAQLRAGGLTPHQVAMGTSVLLRRVSLAFDSELAQSTLLDEQWLARLQALAPGLADDGRLRDALLRAPYDSRVVFDVDALLGALERWLRALPPPRGLARV